MGEPTTAKYDVKLGLLIERVTRAALIVREAEQTLLAWEQEDADLDRQIEARLGAGAAGAVA